MFGFFPLRAPPPPLHVAAVTPTARHCGPPPAAAGRPVSANAVTPLCWNDPRPGSFVTNRVWPHPPIETIVSHEKLLGTSAFGPLIIAVLPLPGMRSVSMYTFTIWNENPNGAFHWLNPTSAKPRSNWTAMGFSEMLNHVRSHSLSLACCPLTYLKSDASGYT